MHALLVLSTLLLVLVSAHLILMLSQRVSAWSRRRKLQMLALVAPVTALGLAIFGVHHFVGRLCLVGAPGWDTVIAATLVLSLVAVALGGLLLSLLRLTVMRWILSR